MKLASTPSLGVLLLAAGLMVIPAPADSAVRARAIGAWVNVPAYGAADRSVCDAGWLPAGGGHQTATATSYVAGTALMMDQGTAYVDSDDDCDDDGADFDVARVDLGYTVLMPGYASEVTFTALSDRDDDECCDENDDDFSPAVIENLTFAGEPVIVTGLPNQVVAIPGVGVLIINEIDRLGRDDDDCDDDDFAVNALHLFPESGGEIIVSQVIYDDDDDCCPTRLLRSTWGRVKTLYR